MADAFLPFQRDQLVPTASAPYTVLEVFQVFWTSLSQERAFRQLSEEYLQQAHASDPTWIVKLLAFATAPVESLHSEVARQYQEHRRQGGGGSAQFSDAVRSMAAQQGTTVDQCQASGLLLPVDSRATTEATMVAAAIRLRNALSGIAHQQQYGERTANGVTERVVVGTTRMSADWRKNELVHPEARAIIKANLLEVCSSSTLVSEKVRAQLLSLMQHIADLEVTPLRAPKKKSKKGQALAIPERPWNAVLVPDLLQRLHATYTSLQRNFTAEAATFPAPTADALVSNTQSQLALLKQLRALLMVLRLVAKRYADVTVFTDVEEVEDFHNTLYPAAIQILQMLQDAFVHHFGPNGKLRVALAILAGGADENSLLVNSVCGVASSLLGPQPNVTSEAFFDTPLLSGSREHDAFVADFNGVVRAVNQCVRFSLKSLWPSLTLQLPDAVCDIDDNEAENLLRWRCQQGGSVGRSIPEAGYLAQLMTLLLNAWCQRTELLYGGDVVAAILNKLGESVVDPNLCTALVQEHQAAGGNVRTWCDPMLQGVFTTRLGVVGISSIPASRQILTDAADVYEATSNSPYWSSLKWVAKFMHSLQLQLGSTANFSKVADQEKQAARVYQLCFAPEVLLRMVVHVAYHHCPLGGITNDLLQGSALQYTQLADRLGAAINLPLAGSSGAPSSPPAHQQLTTPSLIFAFEFIEATTSNATLYHGLLNRGCNVGALDIPHLLMTKYTFQRLAYSTEDERLWEENPEEFVRKLSSALGDEFSPKAVGMSLILKLCTKSPYLPEEEAAIAAAKKKQRKAANANSNNSTLPEANAVAHGKFMGFVQFVMAELDRGAQPNMQGRDQLVDACLYAIEALRKSLSIIHVPQQAIENLLCTHVHRELSNPNGFLRARAVFVLGSFSKGIQVWSDAPTYHRLLADILPLLGDAQLPVRMQTCFSLSALIQRQEAKPVVVPQIVPLIEQYFKMMKEMDSDRVISTLRHTIKYYSETLSQWAVSLCEFLVGHFSTLYEQTTFQAGQLATEDGSMEGVDASLAALSSGRGGKRGDRRGGMDIEDLIAASDELIETISTLISSLPKVIREEGSGAPIDDGLVQVYLKVQAALAPMILHLINASNPQFLGEQNLSLDTSAASFSFLDGLLGMLTTLIEHSGVVVSPSLWPVLSALQGLLTNNSALEYFGSISAPIDNMISVDVIGFLRSAGGRLWPIQHGAQSSNGSASEVLQACVDLVLHTGSAAFLPPHHLRQSEIAAAPRLVECLFTNVLLAEGVIAHPNEVARNYADSYRAHIGGGPNRLTVEEVAHAVNTLIPSCVTAAMQAQQTATPDHIRISHTNLYLIAMATTSALAAAPAITAEALVRASNGQVTPAAFFWSLSSMTSTLLKADFVQMRQFHTIAVATTQMVQYVVGTAANDTPHDSYCGLIAAALSSVVLPELALPVVSHAADQVANMHDYVLKEIKDHVPGGTLKKRRAPGGDSDDDDDSGEEQESGDWEDDGSSGDSDLADGSQFQQILNKAAEHRGQALGGDDDDDGEGVYREVAELEMNENQLEDFESWSPIDDFNAWAGLRNAMQALLVEFDNSSPAARLLVMGAGNGGEVANRLQSGIRDLGLQCEQLSERFDQLQADKRKLLSLN